MLKPLRTLSNGCVRLEDAQRLGLWLMGAPLPRGVTRPETEIALPRPVPVYLTYLTAYPTAKGIAFRADLYGRDRLSPRQGAIGAAPAVAVR
jgi:murein L,D-transpeptidase YcbB/YkuD